MSSWRRAEHLAEAAGLRVVDVTPKLPPLRGQWAMAGQVAFVADLGSAYPDRIGELSPEMRMGLEGAMQRFTLEKAASIESYRRQLNEAMADLFAQADFVMCSSNPDVAFAAEGPPPFTIPGADLIEEIGFTRAIMNNAALTAPSNLNGSPAMSIPAGVVDGLPVGLQVLAAHHREQLLLDLALVAERELRLAKGGAGFTPHAVRHQPHATATCRAPDNERPRRRAFLRSSTDVRARAFRARSSAERWPAVRTCSTPA